MKNLKSNFIVKFVLTLFAVSFLLGIFTFIVYKPDVTDYISQFKDLILNTNQNVFLLDIGVISLILVLSISIIGIPAILFYLFLEGFSIGYTMGLFIINHHVNGFIFYSLFLLISKAIYIIVLLYFVIMSIKFAERLLESISEKDHNKLYKTITYHFYRFIVVISIIVINSTFIYFFANKLLKMLLNMI